VSDPFDNRLIESIIRANFSFSEIGSVTRLHGGYVKHTYRVILDRKPYVLQIWKEPDTFLTSTDEGAEDGLFGNYLENLVDVQDILRAHSIRTPEIIFADTSQEVLPYDYCLMEYISGGNLFENEAKFTDPEFLKMLATGLRRINKIKREDRGLLKKANRKPPPYQELIDGSVRELEICLEHDCFGPETSKAVVERLSSLKESIRPRDSYNLILPDFKPDHILFTEFGEIVLIDCEDVQFYDIEFQLAQMMLPTFCFCNCDAFYSAYCANWEFQIDPSRLSLYQLSKAISYIAVSIEHLMQSPERSGLHTDLVNDGKKVVNHFLTERNLAPILPEAFLRHAVGSAYLQRALGSNLHS